MPAPGTLVANRFVVERQAGVGGMSTVYRARDMRSGKPVALKLLGERASGSLEVLHDEARALAALGHPGIVRYVDHGSVDEGPYLAMEWIEGESLDERLARGLLSVPETLTLGVRVASALSAAHAAGLVHRDIKPSNLLLPGGEVEKATLVDFGVAHVAATAITQTGAIVGTPAYMSPEQAKGERGIDARADVFSLGCVLYECLTGQPPFRGSHVMAVLLKVVLEDPPRLRELVPEVPDALDDIVWRMLAKDRTARPADGGELERALTMLRLPRRAAVSSGALQAVLTAGEQRLLSIVLARAPHDAVGQDDTIAMVDPHEAGGTLDAVRHAAQAHQAFHERLADGSIVATLSATGAATDLAVRAARLAGSLRTVLRGWALSLATGRGELSARWPVGEAVDRAVEQLGAPGAIRLDETSAALLASHFEIDGDERAPELGAEIEGPEMRRLVLGRPTPTVGRERELLSILGTFEHCLAEPAARTTLVVGVPGIGKSRLRHELSHSIAGRAEILTARGDALRAGTPYGLLAPAIRRLCRMRPADDLETRRRRLAARIDRTLPGAAGRRVSHFIGELAGVPFADEDVQLQAARQDPLLMSDQILRAFVEWLAAECSRGAFAIVLDDLHWGDGPTIRLVDAALGALADRPLFVLGLARPEVEVAFPDLWASRAVHRVTLGPLSRRAGERLARSVLGADIPAERLSWLVAHAEGNAFFLEELVRAEAAGRGAQAPATVLAMLHARIEALAPAARRVLRAASVFGRTFWRGGIDALLGDFGGLDLDAELDALLRAEIVTRRADSRFAGEEQFQMRHDLFREAAYGTLTAADRTLGHRLAARWLQRVGETDALVLAEHLERGGQAARAVPWWVFAARQALEADDLDAAIARAERGVSAGATGAPLGALRLAQLEASNWRGDSVRALEVGLQALDALPRGGAAWFAAAGEVAAAAGRLGASDRLRMMADLLADTRPTDEDAEAAAALACARATPPLVYATERQRADVLVGRLPVVDDALSVRQPRLAGHIRWARAIRDLAAGDTGAYLVDMQAAAGHFERAGDLRSVCLSRVHVGYAAMELGDVQRAEELLREALQIAQRINVPVVALIALHNLGLALLKRGTLEEALTVETAARDGARELHNARIECASRCYLAAIHLRQGATDQARREIEDALAVIDEPVPPATADGPREAPRPGKPVGVMALTTLAQIRAAGGDPSGALAASRRAMAILEHLGALEEGEGLVRLVHAESLQAAGFGDAARATLRAARDRLLERASRIGDEALRTSFLGRVEEHARTLALCTAWGLEP